MRNEKKALLFDGFVAIMRASKPDVPDELKPHYEAIANYHYKNGNLQELGNLIDQYGYYPTSSDIKMINKMIDTPFIKQIPNKVYANNEDLGRWIIAGRKTSQDRWQLLSSAIQETLKESVLPEFNKSQLAFMYNLSAAYQAIIETETGDYFQRQVVLAEKQMNESLEEE